MRLLPRRLPLSRLALLALCLVVATGLWSPFGGGAYPAASQDTAAETGESPADGATTDGPNQDGGAAGTESHGGGESGHGDAGGEGHGDSHGGPVVPVLLGLVIILVGAKLGGALFELIDQPAVLGELVVGIILGNLALLGYDGMEFLATNQGIEILAQLGVILLLFEVGLESNVQEMMSVGLSSLFVALLGVVAPFFLGWGVSAWMLPDEELLVHLFIGATLCATSVGITARVLTDLGKIQARESKIILGAAVIDDVLGLVILAVVSGIITATNTGGELASLDVAMILVKAIVFLLGAVLLGGWISPRAFKIASKLRGQGLLLVMALIFAFGLSYLADLLGLATIVGAFAAGLILDEVHYQSLRDWRQKRIEHLLRPIATFLVPIFFVWIGARVDLTSFGQVEILGFAALLSLAAIVGKMICALGVVEKGLDRISVAVGMVPRGEVGLIFAGIGASLMLHGQRVINESVFAAVVIMVIVTTLVTPPALKITLARGDRIKARRSEEPEPDRST